MVLAVGDGVGGHQDVPQMGGFVFSLHFTDVAHHDIHKSILDEAEKHEYGAGRHENVYGLKDEEDLSVGLL